MQEGSTKSVKLPEDQPQAFERILQWVHGKEISKPRRDWDLSKARCLYQTFCLADKLCIEVLTNEIMDLIVDRHRDVWTCPILIPEILESPLKEFGKAQLAWDLRNPEIWGRKVIADQLRGFFVSGPPVIVEVMRASVELIRDFEEGKVVVEPCQEPKCKYHKHVDSEKCKEEVRRHAD